MEWTKEAEARMKKAPFFIRNIARNKAEEIARNRGKIIVDIEDIEIAKAGKEMEDLTTMDLSIDGIENSRFIDMALCGGVKGCPLTLFDDEGVARIFDRVIKELDLHNILESKVEGPILYHNKFRAAISGCPNSCSHPQIKDISIVGYSIPRVNKGWCTNCNCCVKSCPEGLISVEKDPIIKLEDCLHCGKCIKSCPTNSIKDLKKGYNILIGGRLGRRPHLAKKIIDVQNLQQLEEVLKKLMTLYRQCIVEGKNFSKVVEGSTIEDIKAKIHI